MNQYVLLAKQAVEKYVKDCETISPPADLPQDFLQNKAGVFVTIEIDNELRGCIGTYLPQKNNIAEEIISNAIAAASEDWRFGPVKEKELSLLSYAVYVLNDPVPIKSISELDPKKFGIIIKTHDAYPKCGLLLPGLEGINTAKEQIIAACQKGEINLREENIIIYKFEAKKYSQDEQ